MNRMRNEITIYRKCPVPGGLAGMYVEWHGDSNYVPCSGKLSREKTFANFVNLGPFLKIFSTRRGVATERPHSRV